MDDVAGLIKTEENRLALSKNTKLIDKFTCQLPRQSPHHHVYTKSCGFEPSHTFATMIGSTLNRYESNNIEKLQPLLTEDHQQALLQLIEKDEQVYQRPLLIALKTINQSIRPVQIKRSIHGFLIIKKLYQEVEPLITGWLKPGIQMFK